MALDEVPLSAIGGAEDLRDARAADLPASFRQTPAQWDGEGRDSIDFCKLLVIHGFSELAAAPGGLAQLGKKRSEAFGIQSEEGLAAFTCGG